MSVVTLTGDRRDLPYGTLLIGNQLINLKSAAAKQRLRADVTRINWTHGLDVPGEEFRKMKVLQQDLDHIVKADGKAAAMQWKVLRREEEKERRKAERLEADREKNERKQMAMEKKAEEKKRRMQVKADKKERKQWKKSDTICMCKYALQWDSRCTHHAIMQTFSENNSEHMLVKEKEEERLRKIAEKEEKKRLLNRERDEAKKRKVAKKEEKKRLLNIEKEMKLQKKERKDEMKRNMLEKDEIKKLANKKREEKKKGIAPKEQSLLNKVREDQMKRKIEDREETNRLIRENRALKTDLMFNLAFFARKSITFPFA